MDWPIVINALFVGAVLLLGGIVAAVVSNRASRSLARKTDLETLGSYYRDLQITYLSEVERLNLRIGKLQNDNDALLNKIAENRAECQKQISDMTTVNVEQQRQLTTLLRQGEDMVRKVVIVGADIPVDAEGKSLNPVPALIVGPLPLPTAAQTEAAKKIIAEAADTAKGVLADAADAAKEKE